MSIRRKSMRDQLTSDQFNTLVQIVIEESGYTLTRVQFNEAILMLFENISGFETLSRQQSNRYLNTLWLMYGDHRNAEPGR